MRSHLYYPVIKDGHALVSAARIWFLDPLEAPADVLISQDIWNSKDGSTALPNPWTGSPAIIDAWFTDPQRIRLKIQEYQGHTYYLDNIDVMPSADGLFFSNNALGIDGSWNSAGVLTAVNNREAQWGPTILAAGDPPIIPRVSALAPGEGDGVDLSYVNQTVTWTRHLQDTSLGYGLPQGLIKFRLDSALGEYVSLTLNSNLPGAPSAVAQFSGDSFSDTFSDSFRGAATYINTTSTTLGPPVDGEVMVASIHDNILDLYQGSFSSTVPVMSWIVDINSGTDHSFYSFYMDNSIPPVAVDSTTAATPIWS